MLGGLNTTLKSSLHNLEIKNKRKLKLVVLLHVLNLLFHTYLHLKAKKLTIKTQKTYLIG